MCISRCSKLFVCGCGDFILVFRNFATMKKAIVVGASSGIGHEVARILIHDGWYVGVVARRESLLKSLRDLAPNRVTSMVCDIKSPDAPSCIEELIKSIGGIDLYFHAAGIGLQNLELESQIELDTVNTNVVGFCRLLDFVFCYMKSNGGGHIAVISSIAGTKGLGPAPSYSASKAFQSTYIQALEQLANGLHLPINFTDIRPGFVDTPLIAGSKFPMKMPVADVAHKIVRGVYHRRHVMVVDNRYRLLVFFWRLIPDWLWRRLRLVRRY